ncbi:uncharacterized protein LOC126798265 [Argentina anserina]|uniref:uncharacterized protein LOC126798265 n=1 Tax=Argentina anserina TaxID=57926 RepID=UPI0021762AC0|nr:uncharacterized protein LOC126798265 [Potentilla anserina]
MPQVDLETLVSACAGGSIDRKIACETQADPDRPEDDDDANPDEPVLHADFPPESFWLSKDAEYDWFDRNAFFERKDSTKGTNSNSTNLHPNSNNNSQRFSINLKSKASMIGLPKPQKTNYADTKHRRNCKAVNGRLFPKRSGSVGKSTDGSMIEPSSPKVSCMGRVRSKRDRKRRWRNRQQRSINDTSSSMEKSVKPVERRKFGFLASFRGLFRHGRRDKSKGEKHAPLFADSPPRRSSVARRAAFDYETASCDSLPRQSTESEPPGIGGMKRFVSGRRSGSWVEEHGIDVA